MPEMSHIDHSRKQITYVGHVLQGYTPQVPLLWANRRVGEDLLRRVPDDGLDLQLGAFPQRSYTLFGRLFLEFAERFG
jgi:hypothetical protein